MARKDASTREFSAGDLFGEEKRVRVDRGGETTTKNLDEGYRRTTVVVPSRKFLVIQTYCKMTDQKLQDAIEEAFDRYIEANIPDDLVRALGGTTE